MINGLLSDNGFILPRTEQLDQLRIVHPGFLGNILIGIVAAGLSWGLYGPLSMTPIFSPLPVTESLTLSALVGAVVVGIGGARWITNEIDKKVLRVAASKAAADLLSYQYAVCSGLDVVRVRPFNHIGPRQEPQYAVAHFAKQLFDFGGELRSGFIPVRRNF